MQSVNRQTSIAKRGLLRATLLGACALGAVALLAGCAAIEQQTPEQIVAKRAQERWQALIAKDVKSAYGYLAPSIRAVNSYDRYVDSFGRDAKWRSADVISVACEPEKCLARVQIVSPPPPLVRFKGNIQSSYDETWLLEDGQWWLYEKL